MSIFTQYNGRIIGNNNDNGNKFPMNWQFLYFSYMIHIKYIHFVQNINMKELFAANKNNYNYIYIHITNIQYIKSILIFKLTQ